MGVHAKSSIGSVAVSIPNPCLLGGASITLICAVNLKSSSITIYSETSSKSHVEGTLRSFNAHIGEPYKASPPSAAIAPLRGFREALPAATSTIADRRSDHGSGHWTHPAVLDCTCHLAAALAKPTGKLK